MQAPKEHGWFPALLPGAPLAFGVVGVRLAGERIPHFLLTEEKILDVAAGSLPPRMISYETCFCGWILESHRF